MNLKLVFKLKLIVLSTLLLVFFSGSVHAQNLDAKGFVNGSDIDGATDKSGAIVISEPLAKGSWRVKNNGSESITFTGASLDYAGLLPDTDLSFNETIAPGGENKGAGSATLPDWAFLSKGYYQIKVQAFAGGNNPVIAKTFWVQLGEGSPITGVLGGLGAALAALALLSGVFGVVKASVVPRILGSVFAFVGLPLLMLAFGLPSALQSGLFLGVWLGSTVVYTILLKVLAGTASSAAA